MYPLNCGLVKLSYSSVDVPLLDLEDCFLLVTGYHLVLAVTDDTNFNFVTLKADLLRI
jgi:hypothetical protein